MIFKAFKWYLYKRQFFNFDIAFVGLETAIINKKRNSLSDYFGYFVPKIF